MAKTRGQQLLLYSLPIASNLGKPEFTFRILGILLSRALGKLDNIYIFLQELDFHLILFSSVQYKFSHCFACFGLLNLFI